MAACARPAARRSSWDAGRRRCARAVLLSPLDISAARMAPGDFAPGVLQRRHCLLPRAGEVADENQHLPPDVAEQSRAWRSYHFATHGIAALISRLGLAPHSPSSSSFFRCSPPACWRPPSRPHGRSAPWSRSRSQGTAAARLGSILLVFVLGRHRPAVSAAVSARTIAPLRAVAENYELWGPASIVGQNVGAHFLGSQALPQLPPRPCAAGASPVFLIGTGILVKTSAGVALVAGFLLVELWRAIAARRFRPSMPATAVIGVFAATYLTFWVAPSVAPELQSSRSRCST